MNQYLLVPTQGRDLHQRVSLSDALRMSHLVPLSTSRNFSTDFQCNKQSVYVLRRSVFANLTAVPTTIKANRSFPVARTAPVNPKAN